MIVPMKRMTLIGISADQERILSALQKLSAVEVISAGEAKGDETALAAAEERVQRYASALSSLRPYAEKAKLGPKPECTAEELKRDVGEALSVVESTEELERTLSGLRSETDKRRTLIETLLPWQEMDAPIENIRSTSSVRYFTGLTEADELLKLDHVEEAAVQAFGSGRDCALLVACRTEDAENVIAALKNINYAEYTFPKLTGTPEENIRQLQREIASIEAEAAEAGEKLQKTAGSYALLSRACDGAVIERDREAGKLSLGATDATFILEGWVRSDETEKVRAAAASVTDAFYMDFADPTEEEVPPSVVKNNKVVAPFEAVTNLYSKPDPRGIDGTPLMAPFYFLFFGMMLSDTGYGLVLFLGCLAFLKLMKPTGMTKGILQVLCYGGISTMICGVFVGTFFGMDWNTFLGTPAGTFPLLFDPMNEPMSMLFLCFGLGLVHMLFGVTVKVWRCAKEGDWKSALFDNASWLMIVIGLIIFAAPGLLGVTAPGWLGKAGIGLAILGAALVFIFTGRGKKIPGRILSGAGKLYDITSYLSDMLSYARVFALGLSTGVIGQVLNTLGSMLYSAFQHGLILQGIGFLLTAVFLTALHLFNLGINTLGCFVHCARLQYVEFFGKFYDAGGRDFLPLGYRTRHVRIKQ